MKNKFYFIVLLCVTIGFIISFSDDYLSSWMASAAPRPYQQQKLFWFYKSTLFWPLTIPAQPLPVYSLVWLRLLGNTLVDILVKVFFYTQLALLLRRMLLCFGKADVIVPATLNRAWYVTLWIAFIPWLIGVIATYLPRLIWPLLEMFPNLLGEEISHALPYAVLFGGAFLVPFLWIIPANLFGLAFFSIEILSLRLDGIVPVSGKTH